MSYFIDFLFLCLLLPGRSRGKCIVFSRKILGGKVVKLFLCQNEFLQTLNMPNVSYSEKDLIANSSMTLYFAD